MMLTIRYKTKNERKPVDTASHVHRCCMPGHRMFLSGIRSDGVRVIIPDQSVMEIIEAEPAVPCEQNPS